MSRLQQEPIRFTRGRSFYQIARSYVGGESYVGLCDGRIIVRGAERAEITKKLKGLSPSVRSLPSLVGT